LHVQRGTGLRVEDCEHRVLVGVVHAVAERVETTRLRPDCERIEHESRRKRKTPPNAQPARVEGDDLVKTAVERVQPVSATAECEDVAERREQPPSA
jgi:transcription elongation factor